LWNDETIPSPSAKVFSVGPIYPKDHKPLLNDRPKGPLQSVLKPISEVVENLTPEQEEDNIVQAIIIGSVSGFCGLFLLIVLVVFIRKYKERPFNFCAEIKTEEEEDEKKVEQGFVFELRSSTDPVIPRLNIEQFRPRHDDIKEEIKESNKPKTDRKDFHGSKMSIDRSQRDDRGRRNRDRSKSRDRDRGDRDRSASRRRGTSRDRGGADRDRDRSRDRARDRSKSRDRSGRDRSKVRRSDSRSGSRGDVRGSRADLSGDKMKRSRSRTSLAEKRLSPLTEDKLSSAEQEPPIKRSESKSSVNKEKRAGRSTSRMRRSESKTSVAAAGENRESRDRKRSDRSKSRQRAESKDRRHRSPSRDGRKERSESKVRDRSESKARGERKERRRSPSKARKRSPSRNRDKSGSKADLSSSRDRDRGSKIDLRDVDRKNGRRKMNRQKDIDPEQEFSEL